MGPLNIQSKEISRVLIIDDDPAAREGFGYPIEDLGLLPVYELGPVNDVETFLMTFGTKADAVLCDYHLKKHDYAQFDGDILTAACFKAGIPSLLCTTFADGHDTINRQSLRFIPSFLRTHSPAPMEIVAAYESCLREMQGNFLPSRRPWRTLVRVVEMENDDGYFYVVVPGWSPSTKIKLYLTDLPVKIRDIIQLGKRLHAQVNIGADCYEDLFFDEWETE
jgi:hypothetical protein